MILDKFEGPDSQAQLVDLSTMEQYEQIGDKAFLSNKSIRKLILPPNVVQLGNWAFAHMHQLEQIVVPKNEMMLGKQCFLDCPRLKEIVVMEDDSDNPGNPFFLCSVVQILQKPLLFLPKEIGSRESHEKYMGKYDAAIQTFLREPDDAGYEPFFLGWFNDEDADGVQKPRFEKQRREEKMLLVMQRLRFSKALSEESRKEFAEYLTSHFEDVLLPMYSRQFGQDVEYVKVLETAGLLTETNRNKLVEALAPGEPEVMAYLLRTEGETEDAFAKFML